MNKEVSTTASACESHANQAEVQGRIDQDLGRMLDESVGQAVGGAADETDPPMPPAELMMNLRLTGRRLAPPLADFEQLMDVSKDARGNPLGYKGTSHNAALVLQNDERVRGAIALDLFSKQRRIVRTVDFEVPGIMNVRSGPSGEDFSDDHEAALSTYLCASTEAGGWGMSVSAAALRHAVTNAAHGNAYHPILDQIRSEPWDGQARLDTFLIRHLRLTDNAYHREVSRLLFVAAITRLFEPGHKFDFVPVFEGLTGKAKSSFIEAISLGFSGEINQPRELTDAKVMNEVTNGCWFVELPELSALLGVHHNAVKSKISSRRDKARGAYSAWTEDRPRSFVMIGTTNERKYLFDPNGNRRFWPVRVGAFGPDEGVDLEAVSAEIRDVYREALVEYRRMRKEQPGGVLGLFLKGKAREIAERLQGSATVESPEQSIAGWIEDWLTEQHAGKFTVLVGGRAYRARFCAEEAFAEYHRARGADRVPPYGQKEARMMGAAISLVGMVSEGPKARFPEYGQQRSYEVDAEALAAALGINSDPAPAPALAVAGHHDWDEADAFDAADRAPR